VNSSSPPTKTSPPARLAAALFMLVPLIVGFVPPGIVFGLMPESVSRLGLTKVPIPAWVFIGVWLVAYPGMGLAAFTVWRRRAGIAVSVPLSILVCAFCCSLSFWLTNGLLMTATLDALNLLLAWTTLWVFSRYSTRAAVALLPWALWMPVTLAFKLYALWHA